MTADPNVDAKIRSIMARIFDVPAESITPQTRRRELERWDSLSHLALLGALQDEFRIEIQPDIALEIESFEDVRRAVLGSHGTLSHG